jgi:preprotein translocase subunit YajC
MRSWTRVRTVTAVAAILAVSGVGAFFAVGAAGAAESGGLTGTITEVGPGSIAIKPGNAAAVTVKLNDSTVVKVVGKPVASAADLKVGMRAIALGQHLSLGQPATEIRAYPSPAGTGQTNQPASRAAPAVGMTGTITEVGTNSIALKAGNAPAVTVKIAAATVVRLAGKPVASVADLKVGMRALALGEHLSTGQPATEIRAYRPQLGSSQTSPSATRPAAAASLLGVITELGNGSITIKPGDAPAVTVKISDATMVKLAGKPAANAADLKVGMRAMAVGEHLSTGQAATEIRAYPPQVGLSQTNQPADPKRP